VLNVINLNDPKAMKRIILFALIVTSVSSFSQTSNNPEPMYPSYKGLVMCGYQGWFRADGDEAGNGWGHFGRGGKFDVENNTIDIWPDVS
jgi:hypothetical protein